jgi:hypothetical protein
MTGLHGAVSLLRRWNRGLLAAMISVCVLTGVVMSAAPAVASAHGKVIGPFSDGTYLAFPPYPNPPKPADDQLSYRSTAAETYHQCAYYNQTIEFGVWESQCSGVSISTCWQQHNWAGACVGAFTVTYHPHQPGSTVKTFAATFMWQIIDGHVCQVQPYAYWEEGGQLAADFASTLPR